MFIMIASLIASTLFVGLQPMKAVDFPPIVTQKKLYAKHDYRGKKAPELIVETWLNGEMPDVKGKVVMIDFWATWCGPCVNSIPELNEWSHRFKDDLVIIGISNENADVVRSFMKRTEMHYLVAIDTQGRMSDKVGVEGIPHALIISKDGIVRWQGFPGDTADKLTTEKMQQIIAANRALSEK